MIVGLSKVNKVNKFERMNALLWNQDGCVL